MQILSKVGFVKLYLVLAACAGSVQFVAPMMQPDPTENPKPQKMSRWDKITGKGKRKITLIKGNIEERKEPWSYQIIVDQAGPTKKSNPKIFYKDATISFDLADGTQQGIQVIGTGAFERGGLYLPVIENGHFLPDYKQAPTIEIFGGDTQVSTGVLANYNAYAGVKKADINKEIQYQIDQIKGTMKSARAKVDRGLTTFKAGATQVGQAFSRKKLTVSEPVQPGADF